MAASVHFIDNRASSRSSNLARLKKLVLRAGLTEVVSKNDLVAVKLSFGERGNVGYVHPVYVAALVESIKRCGGRPLLMDSNTLYAGSRGNAYDATVTALRNGFSYATVGAPILILDGLRGHDYREVAIPGDIYKKVKIGSGLLEADSMVSVAHFKGHVLGGFGGQIKNLAMGGAPRSGKQMMHADFRPKVNDLKCTGCGTCAKWCPEGAITLSRASGEGRRTKQHPIGSAHKVATIDAGACVGCGECVSSCTFSAIKASYKSSAEKVQRKMAEFAMGALDGKHGRFLGVSFILRVTPDCDCTFWSDAAIVPDVGIAAGIDPVALDQAAYDLVNQQPGLECSVLGREGSSSPDKFAYIHKVDPTAQLAHGEAIGLGSRDYELVRL